MRGLEHIRQLGRDSIKGSRSVSLFGRSGDESSEAVFRGGSSDAKGDEDDQRHVSDNMVVERLK